MDWRDQGALLSVRGHGETSAIVEVFTAAHGRHAGLVRGGASRRLAPLLQPGAQLDLEWRARLDEHLGSFRVEPLRARAAAVLGDRAALAGLSAICALLSSALPEREPHPALYARTIALLDALGTPGWPRLYLMWEMRLLDETGFGLDLSRCAVTGATQGLDHVSPRTGRAVSRAGAGEWADRLLPLPACLLDPEAPATPAAVLDGLRTTGHFLASRLAPALGPRPLPEARQRLLAALRRDLPPE
jgi:DNA repair protein RecO (recombination protein O)